MWTLHTRRGHPIKFGWLCNGTKPPQEWQITTEEYGNYYGELPEANQHIFHMAVYAENM